MVLQSSLVFGVPQGKNAAGSHLLAVTVLEELLPFHLRKKRLCCAGKCWGEQISWALHSVASKAHCLPAARLCFILTTILLLWVLGSMAMPAYPLCLFLNSSWFVSMDSGQSQALTGSQAQAFLGVPTSAVSERVQAVQYIIWYAVIPSAWFLFASQWQECMTPPSLHPIHSHHSLFTTKALYSQECLGTQQTDHKHYSILARGTGMLGSLFLREGVLFGLLSVLPPVSWK